MGHRIPLIFMVLGMLAGCSDESPQSQQAAQSEPKITQSTPVPEDRVLESFNVGKQVYVRSLKVDTEGKAIWVGTTAGLHEVGLDDYQVRNTYTRDNGLANEYVFAIGIDEAGYKWFGTNAGGTSRFKDGNWQTFFPMHGLADYWIYSFAQQKNGDFWIGTWAGVNRYNVSTGKMDTFVKELVNEWVYGIQVDSKDRVWFGTEGGVSMYDGKTWTSWSHKDGIGAPNAQGLEASANTGLGTRERHDLGILSGGAATYNPNYVFSVFIDPQDKVWVGTWGGGVSVYDGKSWKSFTTKDGLAGDIVYSLTQDKDGVYWFGTNRGLSRYDGKSWKTFNVFNGLLGNDVYALDVDEKNHVWVGTRAGVSRIGDGA